MLPSALQQGYDRFRSGAFRRQKELYETLAADGQAPKTLVIACCDSRCDPAIIFDASPGELFVVRNVANLVPPYEPDGEYHGTSAAIEFAVTVLQVSHILIMGHAQCGGVAAALSQDLDKPAAGSFISKWISLLKESKATVLEHHDHDHQTALEEETIRTSIKNLATFPYIKERMDDGRLSLHGAHFGIADGHLTVLNV